MNNNNEIKMIDKNYELIKFEDGDFSLDVNVSPTEDTVWLTQAQIAELYERDRKTITRHIQNIFKDFELEENSVCSFFEHTASDGKKYHVQYYNLDMILSIGYRVKSKRGIMFRRWANSILKQYLLKGHVINEYRCMAHSDNIIQMSNKIDEINLKICDHNSRLTSLENIFSIETFKDKIFYDGQLFEGYSFIKNLFVKANRYKYTYYYLYLSIKSYY